MPQLAQRHLFLIKPDILVELCTRFAIHRNWQERTQTPIPFTNLTGVQKVHDFHAIFDIRRLLSPSFQIAKFI